MRWKRHHVYGTPYTVKTPYSSKDGVEEMLSAYWAIDYADTTTIHDGPSFVSVRWESTLKGIASTHLVNQYAFHTLVASRPDFVPRIETAEGQVVCNICGKDFGWTSRDHLERVLKDLYKYGVAICRRGHDALPDTVDSPALQAVVKHAAARTQPWVLNHQQITSVRAREEGWATYEDVAPRLSICRCCGENIAKQTTRLTFVLPTPPEAGWKNKYTRWAHMHVTCEPAAVAVTQGESL
jgi:hypothetical protein